MRAPRALACSSSSSTSMPPPPAMTKPSRSLSKAREAFVGSSLRLVESAPMQSNMAVNSQHSFSPAPTMAMSALSSWICSMPMPMQWAPVEHAEEIEKDGPCSLKAEDSTAETVEPMVRVTRYGPTLDGHLFACASTAPTAWVTSRMEVPPWPRMLAQRGLPWYCPASSPESWMARSKATYANWALGPMKRSDFRGMSSFSSASERSGRPQTLLLMPYLAYSSENLMPDLAFARESATSSSVFPRQLVMPMPVTTTRRSPSAALAVRAPASRRRFSAERDAARKANAPARLPAFHTLAEGCSAGTAARYLSALPCTFFRTSWTSACDAETGVMKASLACIDL
mmetsp:Transcript_97784/g.237812  ORF Transcript_97784/g.237812 Transcript_97784/m.237812 type:complete len:342 (-) Transcript_97784:166-1191(-)